MKSAIIYTRVSTCGQAEEGVSLDAQLARCREHCQKLGAKVWNEYVDAGNSGFSGPRQVFEAAIQEACAKRVTYFVCYDSSRYARNSLVAETTKHALELAGVELKYVNLDLDRSNPVGRMLDRMMSSIDQLYSEQNGVNTKRSMVALVQKGCWVNGVAPFGYQKEKNTKHPKLLIHPDEAVQVRMVFEWRLSGIGASDIAEKLRTMGLMRRGKPWNKIKVLTLLKHPIVYGEIIYNREDTKRRTVRPESEWIRHPNACPAIINRDDWDDVQDLIAEAAPIQGRVSAKSTRLFTGLIVCGQCGSAMQICTGTGKSKRTYYYYQCGNYIRHKICDKQSYPAVMIDVQVLNLMLSQVLRKTVVSDLANALKSSITEQLGETQSRRQLMERSLADCRRKIQRLYEAIEEGDLAISDITPRLREHRNTETALVASLQSLIDEEEVHIPEINADISARILQEMGTALRSELNSKRTRAWLKSFVKRLAVKPESVVLEYDPGRFAAVATGVPSNSMWLPKPDLLGTKTITIPLIRDAHGMRLAA